jgi:hypothetical protein
MAREGAAIEAQGVGVVPEEDPTAEGTGGMRGVLLKSFKDAGGYSGLTGGLF